MKETTIDVIYITRTKAIFKTNKIIYKQSHTYLSMYRYLHLIFLEYPNPTAFSKAPSRWRYRKTLGDIASATTWSSRACSARAGRASWWRRATGTLVSRIRVICSS